MLSEWPEEHQEPKPERTVLLYQLTRLHGRVVATIADLEDRKRDKNEGPTTIRAELAYALTDVFQAHFPMLKPKRYKNDLEPDLPSSEYPTFIALCAHEIFGDEVVVAGWMLDDNEKLRLPE